MKRLLTFLFLSSFVFSYSQENRTNDSVYTVKMTCEKGDEKAKIDFSNGIYNYYKYGLQASITPKGEVGFDDYYKNYMLKKYSIIIENKGCVTTDYSECYVATMDKLILAKFGADIFKRSKNEAKKMFAQQ